jgi:hypothetical protein
LFTAAPSYTPRALSAGRYATLERMLEILLPADESSVSAREAGVAQYLDTVLFHGDERSRAGWAAGIDAVGRELAGGAAVAAMERLAAAERTPRTEAERFFVIFKQSAISAYYLSETGRKSLGYRGDTAVHHFTGCTHPAHQSEG